MVRLDRQNRSEESVKRRTRELGLTKKKKKTPPATLMLAKHWLAAARSRDLDRLVSLYSEDATLKCGCTGTDVYVGHSAIQEYWSSRLATSVRAAFTLVCVQKEGDRVVLDYLSFERKPVRVYMTFEDRKIARSECGPRRGMQAA
jgi:hypothetical protein